LTGWSDTSVLCLMPNWPQILSLWCEANCEQTLYPFGARIGPYLGPAFFARTNRTNKC
jgi:hypothetical protein